jgi:hypothetical protein
VLSDAIAQNISRLIGIKPSGYLLPDKIREILLELPRLGNHRPRVIIVSGQAKVIFGGAWSLAFRCSLSLPSRGGQLSLQLSDARLGQTRTVGLTLEGTVVLLEVLARFVLAAADLKERFCGGYGRRNGRG